MAPNNSLKLTRLASGNSVVPGQPTPPRMRGPSPTRRAASRKLPRDFVARGRWAASGLLRRKSSKSNRESQLPMKTHPALPTLQSDCQAFEALILLLPEAEFLTPRNGWTPRDVVAHLVGWNDHMVEASSSILAGEAPAYYADASYDYKTINRALRCPDAPPFRRRSFFASSGLPWTDLSLSWPPYRLAS